MDSRRLRAILALTILMCAVSVFSSAAEAWWGRRSCASYLEKLKYPLNRRAPHFNAYLQQIKFAMLPRLDLSQGLYLGRLKHEGREDRKVLLYEVGDRIIAVKLKDSDPGWNDFNAREGFWYLLLNKNNIGAHFYGIALIAGKFALGTEYAPGFNTKYLDTAPKAQVIHRTALNQIITTAENLDKLGINPGIDLQFMISPDGATATLIDPELFELKTPHPLHDGVERAHFIVQQLEANFPIVE